MDNQNVDFAYPGKIFADAHACVICVYNLTCMCFVLRYITILCYSSTLCSSLSVSVSLNVRFTTNGVCSKTYNRIYVARTNEDLSPYICNVCEFLETKYCMPTRWLTGPLQKSFSPWLKTTDYGAALFDSPRGGTSPCRVPVYVARTRNNRVISSGDL